MRPLGIPAVKDRIVQTAIKFVIEPIFEREFLEMSYGFPPQFCNVRTRCAKKWKRWWKKVTPFAAV